MLPVGVDPEMTCIGLHEAALSTHLLAAGGAWPRGVTIPRATCKTSLVVVDLSRAQGIHSLSAGGLACLRVARLPASVKVVALDNCTTLSELRPTDGCPQMLSLRLDGCRNLTSMSFRDGAWALECLEELDIAGARASTPARSPHSYWASSLRSLSLRGLRLAGVLEHSWKAHAYAASRHSTSASARRLRRKLCRRSPTLGRRSCDAIYARPQL